MLVSLSVQRFSLYFLNGIFLTLDDIEIVFQHEEEGHLLWEGLGEFSATDVHKQVAISFRTPAYKALNVSLLSF